MPCMQQGSCRQLRGLYLLTVWERLLATHHASKLPPNLYIYNYTKALVRKHDTTYLRLGVACNN